ncbi:MAG: ATP-binding cassette domain-containing protein [Acidobacteriota bacterium]|nr:ATP-binding cassette domain-containing protein [Acidobacteriota bacterium]
MIRVRDLCKRYGGTVAVDGLSFDVQPGRVTGFLGPNGAGKSTTLRLILGLDEPTQGSALVLGKRYRELRRPLLRVGALLDAAAFHGGRTASAHLRCLAVSNRIRVGRVDEVLELVGLAEAANRRAAGFSLGMRQRLGIAAALLGDPEVLLFDEPINGLDPEGIRWVRTLLRSLADEGRTVFISSHLMSEMALTADHLVVIGRGRLLADSDMASFVHRGERAPVFVQSPQLARFLGLVAAAGGEAERTAEGAMVTGLSAADLGDLASAHGVSLHQLRTEQATLEDVFMEQTDAYGEFRASELEATG